MQVPRAAPRRCHAAPVALISAHARRGARCGAQRELERLKHAAPPASPRRAAAGAEETKEQALPAIPSDEERARLRRELEEAKQEKARVEQEQQQAMEEIERLKKALANQQKSSTCTLQ